MSFLLQSYYNMYIQVLRGSLRETLFDWPEGTPDSSKNSDVAPMIKRETLVYGTDDVTYINSELSHINFLVLGAVMSIST